mgnify:CR=1 FL=1
MSEIPTSSPEKKEILDDNARKFTLDTLDESLLKDYDATSFLLITDWLTVGENSEEKLAYKQYVDKSIQILLIKKVTVNGTRTSVKEKISEDTYKELLENSIQRIEKTRFEFTYLQDSIPFSLKYDEFSNSALRVLEVDAASETERESFSPTNFPAPLNEVTGNLSYYGYRIRDNLG